MHTSSDPTAENVPSAAATAVFAATTAVNAGGPPSNPTRVLAYTWTFEVVSQQSEHVVVLGTAVAAFVQNAGRRA